MPLIWILLAIFAIGLVIQLIRAIAVPLAVVVLIGAILYISYQAFAFLYFRGDRFKNIKKSIEKYTQNCNELNEHIEELKQFHADIQSFDYGEGQLQDTSAFNFKRSEWGKTARHSQTHNCSASVCKSANDQPFKYLCKYFDISVSEESLSRFETTLNNFSAAEQGKILLQDEKEQIIKSIAESIPYPILIFSRVRLDKNLGFSPIDLSHLYFPIYTFQYVSAGGNSSMRSEIQLNLDNLEGLVGYLSGLVRFRNSAAGQRALMTPALREEIKARDGYACRCCGISIDDERNLLLEIDHIMPISKGGKTTKSNLQTLCWRCNRSKGAKVQENIAIDFDELTEAPPRHKIKENRLEMAGVFSDPNQFNMEGDMSKKDITAKIEKIVAFEQRLKVEISSISAFLDAGDDEFVVVYLQGEIKSPSSSVDDDFSIVAAVYDSNDRVVATADHFISSEDFMGFDTFSMSIDMPTREISKIKIYPKK